MTTRVNNDIQTMGQNVARAIRELSDIGQCSFADIIKLLDSGHYTTARMFNDRVTKYNKEAGL